MKVFYWIGSALYVVIAFLKLLCNGMEAAYPPMLLAMLLLVLGNQEELQEKMKK